MINKLRLLFIMLLSFTAMSIFAQQKTTRIFEAVKATRNQYNALYVLSESDDKKIKGILRNINNVLNDPRLKGKLHIELLAFSDGVEMHKKTNNYQQLLIAHKNKGG